MEVEPPESGVPPSRGQCPVPPRTPGSLQEPGLQSQRSGHGPLWSLPRGHPPGRGSGSPAPSVAVYLPHFLSTSLSLPAPSLSLLLL